jgi:hypothetical protein
MLLALTMVLIFLPARAPEPEHLETPLAGLTGLLAAEAENALESESAPATPSVASAPG